MAMTYQKLFEPVLLTATAATIFTVPTGSASTLLKGGLVRLTNTSAAAVDVTLYTVPLAGSNGVSNSMFPTKSVPAKDYIDVQVPQMKAGDFLQGFAATAGVVNIQPIAGAYFSS
ncbi:hypothetical protein [Massilia sp. PWRC2]|uniref:hypothetical protein n=1 Tax=Massilia sp. PWRC2 TaxID=2804626 RepID=UPI003CF1AFD5